MIHIFVLLAWFLGGATLYGQEVLTLKNAVATALEHNRSIRIAQLEVQKSEDAVGAARTYRLPSMKLDVFEGQLLTNADFRFPAGSFGVFEATGPIPPADSVIRTPRRPATVVLGRISQPLSQLYRIGLGVRLQELNRDVAQEKLKAQEQAVVNEVKKAYYETLQVQSALRAADKSIELLKEMERVAREMLVQQAVLRSDALEVSARLAQAEYESAKLQHAASTLRQRLNTMLGREIDTRFQVEEVPEPTFAEVDLDAARAQALAQRPEIREARLKVEQARFDRKFKKAEYIPDVSLTLAYLSPFNVEVLPRNTVAAGVMVNWDVFDWGRKKREIAAKNRAIEQAEAGVREAEAQILVEVGHRYHELAEARSLLKAADLARQAAAEKMRIATNRHEYQAALVKDVLETQTALAQSNNDYQQALLAFWTAKADFDQALGRR